MMFSRPSKQVTLVLALSLLVFCLFTYAWILQTYTDAIFACVVMFLRLHELLLAVVSLPSKILRSGSPASNNRLTANTLAPYKYDLLPIGAIKPQGWVQDQLKLQAAGLAGNIYDFYPVVNQSVWLGGNAEYSQLNEGAPYWYNGIVPLAYVLDDDRLKVQANQFLDYVLDHQQDDGWLGPETTNSTRVIWARSLLLQGMMNHAIADPSQERRIVNAFHRFVVIVNSMLKDNYLGMIGMPADGYNFGVSRAHELTVSLQWLYEKHPEGQEDLIWNTMELMFSGAVAGGRDWTTFFVKDAFPTGPSPSGTPGGGFQHGVNLAEGLRYMAQLYRINKNESLIQQSRDAVELTFKYQATASGSITGDEYLGGTSPQRGSELCMTVEMIFSLAYLYRFIGDNRFADLAELAAFNALPAAISSDFWSHQYVTQTNQPWSRNLSATPFYNVGTYGNVFGLDPNYPCCLVNHGQAFPKFLISSFVALGDVGLVHMFLIPATVSTIINGGSVNVTSKTNYPFGNTINYEISAENAFNFYIRVPDWATFRSTIRINNGRFSALSPKDDLLQQVFLNPGQTSVSLTLESTIRIVPRPNNTVSIYHGPLLYALPVEYDIVSFQGPSYSPLAPPALDHILTPTSLWSIAIDPSQIYFSSQNVSTLPNPIYDLGAPPVEIWVVASNVSWEVDQGTAALPPDPVTLVGKPFWTKLVPFGSAKLHMGEMPRVSLPKLDDGSFMSVI